MNKPYGQNNQTAANKKGIQELAGLAGRDLRR